MPPIGDRRPIKPEDRSVFDSPLERAIKTVLSALGLDTPDSQIMALMNPMETGPVGGIMGKIQEAVGKRIANPIKAYHGSPHDFERFSMDKIGTGEGAQAYGHGLYFAERPGVAESYRDALSPMDVNVRGVPGVKWENLAPGMRGVQKGSLDAAKASGKFTAEELDAMSFMSDSDIDKTIASMREQAAMDWRGADARKLWERRAEVLERLKAETQIKPAGRMYEVNIHARPEELLDWDKPLSQQSPEVQKALSTVDPDTYSPTGSDYDPMESGQQTYHRLWESNIRSGKAKPAAVKQAETSENLRRLGVPGIKYLDQGSRAAGEGTKNYVIWDDSLIEIARKYGMAAAVALQQMRQQAQEPQQ